MLSSSQVSPTDRRLEPRGKCQAWHEVEEDKTFPRQLAELKNLKKTKLQPSPISEKKHTISAWYQTVNSA